MNCLDTVFFFYCTVTTYVICISFLYIYLETTICNIYNSNLKVYMCKVVVIWDGILCIDPLCFCYKIKYIIIFKQQKKKSYCCELWYDQHRAPLLNVIKKKKKEKFAFFFFINDFLFIFLCFFLLY